MRSWKNCDKILCIRADNMGDIIMITPALKALKETYAPEIVLLTSSQGKPICGSIPEIDQVIVADLPWVKLQTQCSAAQYRELVERIRNMRFDAAIIFTVYSQSSLPASMLAYQAGIPLRLGYARENPYALLTDWIPDKEPYSVVKHQVQRDLDLVGTIGAETADSNLSLRISKNALRSAKQKLHNADIDITNPFYVFHTGVSEPKREYPAALWNKTLELVRERIGNTILLTGSSSETDMVSRLCSLSLTGVYNIAGLLAIEELIALINEASVVVSVNTAIIHIAAAVQTPVVVLYAQTNPQHTPWKVGHTVLPFSVDKQMRSRNEVIRFVDDNLYNSYVPYPSPETVVKEMFRLTESNNIKFIKLR